MKNKKKDKRTLWVVESYDKDEQQGFTDCVPALTADEANKLVSDVRTYAEVINVQSIRDQLRVAKRMAKMSVAQALKGLQPILMESGKKFCPRCGTVCDVDDEDKNKVCEVCDMKIVATELRKK